MVRYRHSSACACLSDSRSDPDCGHAGGKSLDLDIFGGNDNNGSDV